MARLLAYQEWGELVPEYEAAGIECRRFDLSPAKLGHPWRFAASVVGQAFWARREGVALYYSNSYFRAFHAAAVKYLGGFPAVCHFHITAPQNDYVSRQYRWGLERMDRLIAVSECVAADWRRALGAPPGRISVLHNGVDTDRFRPDDAARASARQEVGAGDDCIVIGFCGRLVAQKGVDVLIHAAARLALQRPRIKLLIIGSDVQSRQDSPERFELKLRALARQLGLSDRIEFLGARGDVERWYNAMDMLALPSIGFDAFPSVIAEALACGRPVVASRIGGIPEILTGPLEELLVPPNDVDALAATLQRLVADPPWRVRMGRLGREVVETQFRVSIFLDQLEHLLKAIAA